MLFGPAGVCFWFCIACHEIWATQNVSTYIVTAYELCSFYAADWVLDQWFTVSLYTATLGGRRAEHIWGLRLLLKPMCRLGWADKGLFLYSLFWLRLINVEQLQRFTLLLLAIGFLHFLTSASNFWIWISCRKPVSHAHAHIIPIILMV